MKLTEKQKSTLRKWGHQDSDFAQIERAAGLTIYERNGETISGENARRLLGETEWLSGLSRSAFHCSAARIDRYGKTILFDSSKLFR